LEILFIILVVIGIFVLFKNGISLAFSLSGGLMGMIVPISVICAVIYILLKLL
tara:strand:+ start:332 stop:490 length:159 start_codon:yes stop_codon:yes gene_type:complete